MKIEVRQFDNQKMLFCVGIIYFVVIAIIGWEKLQYGFTFMDEGYHMVEGWRIAAGDHFLNDTIGSLGNYRLITAFVFKIFPNITLLDFRKLQFILTIIALITFGVALFSFNKQYWFLPYIFSLFAFTGLDPLGATSNLNYYTYPHLFLTLYIAFLVFGLRTDGQKTRAVLLIVAGLFLWAISLTLLHLSIIILAPFCLYGGARIFHLKTIQIKFRDVIFIVAPFIILWTIFLSIYNINYVHSVLYSIKYISSSGYHSLNPFRFNWEVIKYVVLMGILLIFIIFIINRIKKISLILFVLFILSVVTLFAIDTSFFGFFKPYWKDWYSRPMFFAGLLIAFLFIFWSYVSAQKFFFKNELSDCEELALFILIPSTLLFFGLTESSFGIILVLHCSIPIGVALSYFLLNQKNIRFRANLIKLLLLILCFAPFYYMTAWSDWHFTYCDVKPKDAKARIESGFCKGIKTNGVYSKLYDWIQQKTEKYTNKDDYIISYVYTPMTYMIAKRRPAIDNSFAFPLSMNNSATQIYDDREIQKNVKCYQNMIRKMEKNKRNPKIAFVFDNSPALNYVKTKPTANGKFLYTYTLKGNYFFFPPQFSFSSSNDPLTQYIKTNMVLVDSIKYSYGHNIAYCFVDRRIR